MLQFQYEMSIYFQLTKYSADTWVGFWLSLLCSPHPIPSLPGFRIITVFVRLFLRSLTAIVVSLCDIVATSLYKYTSTFCTGMRSKHLFVSVPLLLIGQAFSPAAVHAVCHNVYLLQTGAVLSFHACVWFHKQKCLLSIS